MHLFVVCVPNIYARRLIAWSWLRCLEEIPCTSQKVQTRPFAFERRGIKRSRRAARACDFWVLAAAACRAFWGTNLIPLPFKVSPVFGAAHRPPSEKAKKIRYWSAARRTWPQQIENDKWPKQPLWEVIRFHERWAPNQIKRPHRLFTYICARTRVHSSCVGQNKFPFSLCLFEITCYLLMRFGMFWVILNEICVGAYWGNSLTMCSCGQRWMDRNCGGRPFVPVPDIAY